MENLDTFIAFISWIWYWAWRVLLGIIVVVLVVNHYNTKKIRKLVSHPIDWLVVMSTERFDTMGELAQLMNTRLGFILFKINSYKRIDQEFFTSKFIFGAGRSLIVVDLCYLEEHGLIERRSMFYDKDGKEYPYSDFFKDDLGYPVNPDAQRYEGYQLRHEYRKTPKGGRIKTGKITKQESGTFEIPGVHA